MCLSLYFVREKQLNDGQVRAAAAAGQGYVRQGVAGAGARVTGAAGGQGDQGGQQAGGCWRAIVGEKDSCMWRRERAGEEERASEGGRETCIRPLLREIFYLRSIFPSRSEGRLEEFFRACTIFYSVNGGLV